MKTTLPALLLSFAVAGVTGRLPGQDNHRSLHSAPAQRESKLLSLGDTDRWEIALDAGEVLWCRVRSEAFDPVLQLVDAEGQVIEEQDGAGTQSEVWFTAPRAGSLTFRVSGFQGRGGGRYEFILDRYPTLEVEIAKPIRHRIDAALRQHFRCRLSAGQVIVPFLKGRGRITAVFDVEGRRLDERLGGYRAQGEADVLVRVEGREGDEVVFGARLARVRSMEPAAGGLQCTLPAFGLDCWTARLRAGQAYALHCDMPGSRLEFEWRKLSSDRESGAPVVSIGAQERGGRHRHWLLARRDCEIEVSLRHRGAASADYRLSLVQETETLGVGESREARLALAGGDVHSITVSPGQLLRVEMSSETFDGQIDVRGPDGGLIARCDDAGGLDCGPRFTFLATQSGVHRLLVFSPGGRGAGRYRLIVEDLSIPLFELGAAPSELSWDAGTSRYGLLDLEKGQECWLSARSERCRPSVRILRPDGSELVRFEGGGVGSNLLGACVAAESGRHTVIVASALGGGSCRLRAIDPAESLASPSTR